MSSAPMTQVTIDLDSVNAKLEGAPASRIVEWAVEAFGDGLVLTTSFGVQSTVMLHLVTRIHPGISVVWIDTGFNFPATYRFAKDLARRLSLNLKIYQSHLSPARMVALHGRLWEQGKEGLDKYDRIRKLDPRDRAFDDLNVRGWLSGPRRDQTELRKNMRIVEKSNTVYAVHPILHWAAKDVHDYLRKNDLPSHPLHEKGYASIGDWHSTLPVGGDLDERTGRFAGLKQECGLHLPETPEEDDSRMASGL